ncbi:MAG: SLAP domain-containing protein [Ruminococcaceae bacterium]|nr:SLAP domain-containing protein [Oscillospiraceae bacterium]
MAKKKDIIREIPDSEIELFGAHKTKEEIKADNKARKAKERAALKAEIAARRKEGKSGHPALKEMLPVLIVCGITLVLCVVLLVIQFNRAENNGADAWEYNEELGYFSDVEVAPTMKEGEITERLVEAYYTNNGHLYLRMIFSNGDKRAVQLETVDIRLKNGEDQLIGSGEFNVKNKIIPAEGTLEYACYIKPEHLEITNDSLEVITSFIDANGYYIVENDSTTE